MAEFMFFLTGGVGLENTIKNPDPSWISDKCWDELCRMSDIDEFKKIEFRKIFVTQLDEWKKIYDNREPYKVRVLLGCSSVCVCVCVCLVCVCCKNKAILCFLIKELLCL